MNSILRITLPLIAALAVAGCNAGGSSNIPSSSGASQTMTSSASHIPEWEAKHQARRACKELAGGVSCMVLLASKFAPDSCSPSSGSCGLRPIDFQTRYGLGASLSKGAGQKVALIELGDIPSAASDLAYYRKAFNLGTGSFYKFNQYGQQYDYPESCSDFGWCLESDLDIEMVAASCPNCTIYMIEGGNCGGVVCGLEGAETTAVSLGATIISNSWGCHTGVYGANCGDPNFPTYFSASGVAYLASSGDSGYPEIEYPAALQNVLAVGGTQLKRNGSSYSETVWSGAGAGCATAVTKPSWQHDPKCAGRTISDISAQAGCQPSVAEYITTGYSGWVGVCGTSVASPLTAGIVGLAGNASSIYGGSTFWELSKKLHKKELWDINSGDDGSCGDYICQAGLGKKHGGYETYSGPAGWGTPDGIAAY